MSQLELLKDLAQVRNFVDGTDIDAPAINSVKTGVVTVRFQSRGVTKIIISNEESDFLHLRGIELLSHGEQLSSDELPAYSCSSGSVYKGTESPETYEIGSIVDPYAFHTERESLEDRTFAVVFEDAVVLDEIKIYLRKGLETRSLSLHAEVTDGGGHAETVLSNVTAIKARLEERMGDSWKATGLSQSQYLLLSGSSIQASPLRSSRDSYA